MLTHKTNATLLSSLLVFAALGAAGCQKASASVASSGCSATAFKHTNPNFCIDAPPDFQAQPEKKLGPITQLFFERKSDGWNMSVEWGGAGTADSAIGDLKSLDPGGVAVEQGELPGGGYFVHSKESGGSHTVHSVAKGTKGFASCYMQDLTDPALIASVVTACKSLRVE